MANCNLSLAHNSLDYRDISPQATPQVAAGPHLRIVATSDAGATHSDQRNPGLGLAIGLGTGLAFWGSLALLILF